MGGFASCCLKIVCFVCILEIAPLGAMGDSWGFLLWWNLEIQLLDSRVYHQTESLTCGYPARCASSTWIIHWIFVKMVRQWPVAPMWPSTNHQPNHHASHPSSFGERWPQSVRSSDSNCSSGTLPDRRPAWDLKGASMWMAIIRFNQKRHTWQSCN